MLDTRLSMPANHVSEDILSSTTFDTNEAITAIRRGAPLTKYCRGGKPHVCLFKLSDDESELTWESTRHNRRKTISFTAVQCIYIGHQTTIFRKYGKPLEASTSLSIVHDSGQGSQRSLNLVCETVEQHKLWVVGLSSLVERWKNLSKGLSPPPVYGKTVEADTQASHRSYLGNVGDGAGSKDSSKLSLNSGTGGSSPAGTRGNINVEQRSVVRDEGSVGWNPGSLGSVGPGGQHQQQGVSTGPVMGGGQVMGMASGALGLPVGVEPPPGDVYIFGSSPEPIFAKGSVGLNQVRGTERLDVWRAAGGEAHGALLNPQGVLYSWGAGSKGRLGRGAGQGSHTPHRIASLLTQRVAQVVCGPMCTAAVVKDGALFTWGHNSGGMLGHAAVQEGDTVWAPRLVCSGLEGVRVRFVATGARHMAAISSQGALYTWGDNAFGALGHGAQSDSSSHTPAANHNHHRSPRQVQALEGKEALWVACGTWHTAAVVWSSHTSCQSSGLLYTWGDNSQGQLGLGSTQGQWTPARVEGGAPLTDVKQVECGDSHTVALSACGRVFSWGDNTVSPKSTTPLQVKALKDVVVESIACGARHSAAVASGSTELWTWGVAEGGRLGHAKVEALDQPQMVRDLTGRRILHVSCGTECTLVVCVHKSVSQDALRTLEREREIRSSGESRVGMLKWRMQSKLRRSKAKDITLMPSKDDPKDMVLKPRTSNRPPQHPLARSTPAAVLSNSQTMVLHDSHAQAHVRGGTGVSSGLPAGQPSSLHGDTLTRPTGLSKKETVRQLKFLRGLDLLEKWQHRPKLLKPWQSHQQQEASSPPPDSYPLPSSEQSSPVPFSGDYTPSTRNEEAMKHEIDSLRSKLDKERQLRIAISEEVATIKASMATLDVKQQDTMSKVRRTTPETPVLGAGLARDSAAGEGGGRLSLGERMAVPPSPGTPWVSARQQEAEARGWERTARQLQQQNRDLRQQLQSALGTPAEAQSQYTVSQHLTPYQEEERRQQQAAMHYHHQHHNQHHHQPISPTHKNSPSPPTKALASRPEGWTPPDIGRVGGGGEESWLDDDVLDNDDCSSVTSAATSAMTSFRSRFSPTPRENTVEFQPGVFISVVDHMQGHRELRRVRFSQKLFTETDATQWWEQYRKAVLSEFHISSPNPVARMSNPSKKGTSTASTSNVSTPASSRMPSTHSVVHKKA